MVDPDSIQRLFDDSRNLQPRAVVTQIIIMASLSILTLLVFDLLRPTNKYVYEPKTIYHAPNKDPPYISSSFWGWIPPLVRNNEQDLFNKIGLDAITFLRFLRLMRSLFSLTAIVTCGVLIPLDRLYTIASNPPLYDTLSSLTIRDIHGNRLYAHIGCEYFITFLLMALLYHHWSEMFQLRKQWFRTPESRNAFYARTLMITNIPMKYRSEEGLWKIFQGLELKHQVTSVHLGKAVGMLPDLIERHDQNVQEFERVLVKHLKKDPNGRTKPTIRIGGWCGLGGTREDAIKYYTSKLNNSAASVEQYRAQMLKNQPESYGFASMASISAAHGTAFDLREQRPKGITIALAPNPSDIFWRNIALSTPERRFRIVTGFMCLVFLCTFSLIPLFPIASLANFTTLARSGVIPFLRIWILTSPLSYAIVSGSLPPAIAALFSYFLPRVMRKLSSYMGAITHSQLDSVVIARYFTFMIISQLIIFTVIGVIYNSVFELIHTLRIQEVTLQIIFNNLIKIPDRMGRTYIDQSTFWLTWFPLRGFLLIFDLAQLDKLIWVSFKSWMFGRTPREIREWTKPVLYGYDINYAEFLFMGAVGLVFAPLAPLVSLIAAVIFWIGSFVFKYQLMYMFVTRVDTGGRMWNMVTNRVIFSAVFMQLIMIFTIGLQIEFKSLQVVAAIPPLILTLFYKHYINQRFANDFPYYFPRSEETLRELVHSEEADMVERKLETRYDHPALKTELFTPLVFASSIPLLERLFKGKHKEGDLVRDIGVESPFTQTIGVDDALGVTLTPVDDDQLQYDPAQYSRECEEVCDVDWGAHSMLSSGDSAPWRRLHPQVFGDHDQPSSSNPSNILHFPGRREYGQRPSLSSPTTSYHTAAENHNADKSSEPSRSTKPGRRTPSHRFSRHGSLQRETSSRTRSPRSPRLQTLTS